MFACVADELGVNGSHTTLLMLRKHLMPEHIIPKVSLPLLKVEVGLCDFCFLFDKVESSQELILLKRSFLNFPQIFQF